MRKNRNVIAVLVFVLPFLLCNIVYSIDTKEAAKEYVERINPILTDVDILYRNVGQRLLPLEQGAEKIQDYINMLNSLNPPELIRKQHRMILLSFRKMRLSFYLMDRGDRPMSIRLVKSAAHLIKTAAMDIVDFVKREGLVADDNEGIENNGGE